MIWNDAALHAAAAAGMVTPFDPALVNPAVRDCSQTGRYQGQTGATPARPNP